ncbi:hypothetical protein D1872_302290 [compost metagenome]
MRSFLKIEIQAKDVIQDGSIYGMIARNTSVFLKGRLVLIVSQASTPPITIDSKDTHTLMFIEFSNGLYNRD